MILFFILFFAEHVFAQNIDSIKQQLRLEDFLENASESYYLEDDLNYLKNNPVNILSAAKDDLLKLPFINEELANKILKRRNKSGTISKQAFTSIVGNNEIFAIIEPFIYFEPIKKEISLAFSSTLSTEIQNRRGFDTVFEGNKLKSLSKLFFQYTPYNISSGLTIEKDPGELNYYDYYSGFIKYETEDYKFIGGDYRVAFGEGLTFGSQSPGFISDDIASMTAGNKSGLRAYNGTDENNYLRGFAGEINISGVRTLLFYSNKKLDANLSGDSIITSLYTSGLHRYDNEMRKKDAINENIVGGRFAYTLNEHDFSAYFYRAGYNKIFSTSGYYGLSGSSFSGFGIDYNYSSPCLKAAAELARNGENVFAGVLNLGLILDKDYIIYLNAREYPYDYTNPFANGISARGYSQNEEGFLIGIKLSPYHNVEINSYFDIYRLPYRTYYNPLPSKGTDAMAKLQIEINDSYLITFRFNEKNSDECLSINDPIKGDTKVITDKTKRGYRIELNSIPLKNLFLRTRMEYNTLNYIINSHFEKGYIVFQDFLWKPYKSLILNSRIMFFNTDSYETALYEYEREVPGIYGVSALSDKGMRIYFTAEYSLYNYFNIMFKWSNTTFDNKNSIGSSYDELLGKSLSRVSFEIGLKF